ncbi:MAG: hypothetical protein EA350_12765 [Gemmatimonadales bacterium]|nr:MAG: hypothetical protein EA350_12765 [Gemmatimonadales bacterium]
MIRISVRSEGTPPSTGSCCRKSMMGRARAHAASSMRPSIRISSPSGIRTASTDGRGDARSAPVASWAARGCEERSAAAPAAMADARRSPDEITGMNQFRAGLGNPAIRRAPMDGLSGRSDKLRPSSGPVDPCSRKSPMPVVTRCRVRPTQPPTESARREYRRKPPPTLDTGCTSVEHRRVRGVKGRSLPVLSAGFHPCLLETPMLRKSSPMLALASALVLAGCADSPVEPTLLAPDATLENRAPAPGARSIADIVTASARAEQDAEFTLLLAAILYIAETNPESGLIAGLFDKEQYTVFAPTDAAFLGLVAALGVSAETPFADIDAALGAGTVEAVVSYHVVEGRRAANSVVPRVGTRNITTLLGASFQVSPAGVITAIGNTANIGPANISASNGIIHVIDAVILPIN